MQASWKKDQQDESDSAIAREELGLDKVLLQMIQLACKSGQRQRALDITQLLHQPVSYDGAQKVAAFYKLPGLQEKMAALKEAKELKDDALKAAVAKAKFEAASKLESREGLVAALGSKVCKTVMI